MNLKATLLRTLFLPAWLLGSLSPGIGLALDTAFTYQGSLSSGGACASGLYDLRFTIYDSTNQPGNRVAGPVTNVAVAVSNGLLVTRVDLGAGLIGPSNWLELAVSTNGANAFTTLSPRQRLTPTPTALYAAMASNVLGQVSANRLSGSIALAQLPTSLVTNSAQGVNLAGSFSGNGAGLTNLNVSGAAWLVRTQTFSGTNTFTQPLVLSGSAPLLRMMGRSSTATLELSTYDPGTNPPSARIQARDNNWSSDVDFYTKEQGGNPGGLVSRLRLSANGNVGIGTTNPGAPLEVAGPALFDADLIVRGTLAGSGAGLANVPGTLPWNVVKTANAQAQPNTGYLVTNAGEVTITLPASAAVGDKVKIVKSSEGDLRISQNADQSIRVGNAASCDFGWQWTALGVNRSWQYVACSADGTKVIGSVFGGQVYTSIDSGANWTARISTGPCDCSVASSADGTKLVIAAYQGQIHTSGDSGATWTAREANRAWACVASSADGVKLVAAVLEGPIYTSSDSGVTWTVQARTGVWTALASSADGTKLVATTDGGPIYTSGDSGVTWTAREANRAWACVASSADGVKLVATAWQDRLYTSSDSGVTWTARDGNRKWWSVASSADGVRLAAVAFGGPIYISNDSGLTWTARVGNKQWYCVASSAEGATLLAGASPGPMFASTMTPILPHSTTVGVSGYLLGERAALELQYAGHGLWKLLNHEGRLFPY